MNHDNLTVQRRGMRNGLFFIIIFTFNSSDMLHRDEIFFRVSLVAYVAGFLAPLDANVPDHTKLTDALVNNSPAGFS